MVRSSPAVSTLAKTILASRSTWRRLHHPVQWERRGLVEVPIATLGVSMPPIQHRYIELMASDSSVLLRLSMQQVSTYTHSYSFFFCLPTSIQDLWVTTNFILILPVHLCKTNHPFVVNFCAINSRWASELTSYREIFPSNVSDKFLEIIEL